MSIWENFESECVDYLNQQFGKYARFTLKGGSNSTVPDIQVNTIRGKSFYIEAKHSPAQCGQFVLLPNIATQSFEYSQQNANSLNEYAQMIIDHMNKSFDEYREAGTAGKEIDIQNHEHIFSQWIINAYLLKGVRYFITNNFLIFPIEQFQTYFNITAKYRIKRSGSSSVGRGNIDNVLNYLTDNYKINENRIETDKLFIGSEQKLHNQRFILNGHEYMISSRDREYEVRKLSNTYNANVIFSIYPKGVEQGISNSEFISYLQN